MTSVNDESNYGNKIWQENGILHREDGPAYITFSGTECWYLNGERHRVGGPAVTRPDGTMSWWVKGTRAKSALEYQQLTKLSNEEIMVLILKYGDIK